MTHRMAKKKVLCKYCRSEILSDASICPVCCNYQHKNWIAIKNIGAFLGLIAIIGSAATYVTIAFSDLGKIVAWKDEVQVVSFSLIRPSTFLNKGDGEILISHIELESDVIRNRKVVRIDEIIKPGGFCVRNVPAEQVKYRTKHHPLISSYFSEEKWIELIRVRNDHKDCITEDYYYRKDPGLILFSKRLKDNLNTFDAKGTIVYYSGKTGKEIRQEFPVVGAFHISKHGDCYDSIKDIIPEILLKHIEKGL